MAEARSRAATGSASDLARLEVSIATLVSKLDALTTNMGLNIERLIEKMEHGDKESATLFKLTEERLSAFRQNVEPQLGGMKKEQDDFRAGVLAQLKVLDERLDAIDRQQTGVEAVATYKKWIITTLVIGLGGFAVGVASFIQRVASG